MVFVEGVVLSLLLESLMKKFLFIILFLLILVKSIVFVHQERILHPQKRVLQSYHYDWLNDSLKHGMNIEKHFSVDDTPYLIVTQNKTQGLSKRQRILKEQLKHQEVKKEAGTLVLLHGKNGRKEDLLPVAERYVALGFTCLLVDLPHHGESELKRLYYGTKTYEQVYVDEVLEDASKHTNINENALYLWGMSLGGAFAISNVTHSKYNFQAMVLVATFDSLDRVLENKSKALFGEVLGGFLYVSLEKSLKFFYNFEPHKVNSVKMAEKLNIPLYMIHGEKDELIASAQGQRLFESFASKEKTFYLDEEGDHHNILVTKHLFFKESATFLLKER